MKWLILIIAIALIILAVYLIVSGIEYITNKESRKGLHTYNCKYYNADKEAEYLRQTCSPRTYDISMRNLILSREVL